MERMDTTGDDDSEWEYEYDENETEDFYIVLDLPEAATAKQKSKADELFAAHDPTKPKKKTAIGTKGGSKKRRRGAAEPEVENGEEPSLAASAENNESLSAQPNVLQDLENLQLAAAASKSSSEKGLQIMDLESDEPMIMYQGQMYSCHWASSIGSDLLFMRKPENPDADHRPLHAFRDVDILGIGAAKLVASPATIERRQGYELTADENDDDDTTTPSAHNDVIRQAEFLGRIADIKASRGEHIGNLKALAETVQAHPENYGPDKKKGRAPPKGRAAPSPRRRPTVTENRPSPASAEIVPTIASTRTRRASTQSMKSTPARNADADGDEEMAD